MKINKTNLLFTILVSLFVSIILSFVIWVLYYLVTRYLNNSLDKWDLIFNILILIILTLNIFIIYIQFLYATYFYKYNEKSIKRGVDKIE
ncbi:hypothetical protein [Spiroplasma endosymbiont of Seladonia tumulorum]|uniref:hypothetical protein n=1 Tax=Spiroplasma endosymbiont of Seladonia tumulorum TaxID=3066321 RepID=UPI0030D21E4D